MQNIFHVIKDPVHGTMQFSSQENGWIKPFIDSENFQRLRHIKQLGLADWIFPGAVHSRFSHGLGCCYIVSQICNKLGISDEDKQLVMIAGLLHDIGHGPFSHMFEEIFRHKSIQHEMWTPFFMQEYASTEFLRTYNQRNKKNPLTKEKIFQIQDLITHRFEGNKLLADIVSSQLDADRLDYLLRDSHFCGVTYGHYEFRWLLHCLAIINLDGKNRLGITRKGVGVVEEYLMARRLMMRNVYQHGKKIGSEFFMQSFLKELSSNIAKNRLYLTQNESALIQFLQQMDLFNQQLDTERSVKKLTERFIKDNYHLYKQLCDYDLFSLIRKLSGWDESSNAVQLAKRLQDRRLPKVIPIDFKSITKAMQMVDLFQKAHKVPAWQLSIIDLPHLSYTLGEDPILIQESTGVVKSLHTESIMIDALSDKSESLYLACVDQALLDRKEGKKLYNELRNL